MKRFISLLLTFCFVFTLIGCNGNDNVTLDDIIDKKFIYEDGGMFGPYDTFYIKISSDGKFTYLEGNLFGVQRYTTHTGTWEFEDGVLTLTETYRKEKRVNIFKVEKGALVFKKRGSSNFIFVDVPNKGRFIEEVKSSQ